MRTLKGLPYPHNSNYSLFKEGAIRNKTETESGTPVVEEVYGDILTNIYKILEETGVIPNQKQDNENAGYQLLEAIKKLPNSISDVEQVVSLEEDTWSVNFEIDNLPNQFIFYARVSDNFTEGASYFFAGTDSMSYPLSSSTGFETGDLVIFILDKAQVRAYSLSSGKNKSVLSLAIGNPVPFNDSNKIYFYEQGCLLSDDPAIHELEQAIRVSVGSGTLEILEMIIIKGHVLCMTFDQDAYSFFQFPLTNLASPQSIDDLSITHSDGSQPYFFSNGESLFLTNASGNSFNDFELDKYNYEPGSLTFVGSVSLESTFQKTTNTIIKNEHIYTLVNGVLRKYSLSNGMESILFNVKGKNGILFQLKDEIYFGSEGTAKIWSL